jgi:hypothetical protein
MGRMRTKTMTFPNFTSFAPAKSDRSIQAKLAHVAGMSLPRNPESSIRKSPAVAVLSPNSDSLILILGLPSTAAFPLSWTHYVHLLRRARSAEAMHFYETEANL